MSCALIICSIVDTDLSSIASGYYKGGSIDPITLVTDLSGLNHSYSTTRYGQDVAYTFTRNGGCAFVGYYQYQATRFTAVTESGDVLSATRTYSIRDGDDWYQYRFFTDIPKGTTITVRNTNQATIDVFD